MLLVMKKVDGRRSPLSSIQILLISDVLELRVP